MRDALLVVGSLHYDIIVNAPHFPALDETLPGSAVAYVAGGKGGNQAVSAARHGARTYFAGKVGDDDPARILIDYLQASGVDVTGLQRGEAMKSGMSVAIVDDKGDYGAVIVSGANLEIDAEAIAIGDDVGFLILQNEIPEAVNLALAEKARALGIKVILNAAPARDMPPRLLAATSLLIVNRIEAGMMTGLPVQSTEQANEAARLLSHLVGEVIVTLGSQGVLHAVAGDNPVAQPAFRAHPVSSHGAGDSFVGALAGQLAAGSMMDAAIHYAQAAAALHVSTPVDRRHLIRPMQVRNRLGED